VVQARHGLSLRVESAVDQFRLLFERRCGAAHQLGEVIEPAECANLFGNRLGDCGFDDPRAVVEELGPDFTIAGVGMGRVATKGSLEM
jgi:hypothetical protein